ncbi:hypothetical protein AaE_007480, partial [Aphanomyces astaci]
MMQKIPREEGLNHAQEYALGLQKSFGLISFIRENRIDDVDEQEALSEALGDVLPIDMHRKMFIPALQLSMTADQLQTWMPLALSYRILGAYAQTELGHGSNVQCLETTATYDPRTHTFVLHSPTLTSRKWWPGALGKTANFAVVYARLLHNSVDYGVHAFLVQLRCNTCAVLAPIDPLFMYSVYVPRDLATHATLPGITLGDIGSKLAFNMVDNGFCIFDHVHVPASQLCLATARVRWQRSHDDSGGPVNLVAAPAASSKWKYMPMI